MKQVAYICCFLLVLFPVEVFSASDIPVLSVTGEPGQAQTWSLNIKVLVIMTLLTLLPAALMTTTSFLRVIIVFAILRQALGTQQTPSNQILLGLALFTTFFIMAPVFDKVYENGIKPYLSEELTEEVALNRIVTPFREFMTAQTRVEELALFTNMSKSKTSDVKSEIPFSVLLPAFVTSELKTAFQIGFLIFLPFLVIDLVVASVLMSLGMMMLSPMLISLPFKIMLFVLVDGWSLIMGTLMASFGV